MTKPLKDIRFTFRLSKKEFSKVEYLAEKLELNNSDVIRDAINYYYELKGEKDE